MFFCFFIYFKEQKIAFKNSYQKSPTLVNNKKKKLEFMYEVPTHELPFLNIFYQLERIQSRPRVFLFITSM